ncbi:hypothetical protein EAI_05122 [Harpegnathos saltator]|uniref:Uncharacterized protein n=1 Tax=Harpegnathos saltator TaxID=610380 RepID=E2BGB5_HARSA|nr:hypothetical protein EAI_05122 [Harpegnathos saltator]
MYNLENISPMSSDLSPSERIEGCSFHTFRKHRPYHCALRDAYKLKHWFIEQSQINIRKRDNIYVTLCLSFKIDEEDRENSYSYKSGSEQSPVEEEENDTNTELEHSVKPSKTITIALPEKLNSRGYETSKFTKPRLTPPVLFVQKDLMDTLNFYYSKFLSTTLLLALSRNNGVNVGRFCFLWDA